MRRTFRLVVLSAVPASLLACNAVPEEPVSSTPDVVTTRADALTTPNGSNLNGSNLNGSNLNGSNLNGSNLNGQPLGTILTSVNFSNVLLNGKVLDATWLNGTMFTGIKGSSTSQGHDFLNAEFVGNVADGSTVRLRITSIESATNGDSEVWNYRVDYRDDAKGSWFSICKDQNGPTHAIPVNGRWNHEQGVAGGGAKVADPGVFTFACLGTSAIAKCVTPIGYKPWKSVNGTSLDRHHQACVRLIRADYCGDGVSHTVDGTWVNLYDGLGIQNDTENWVVEAEWDENGARCFYPLNRSNEAVPCYDQRQDLGCGAPAHFQTGTLLINETEGDGIVDDAL